MREFYGNMKQSIFEFSINSNIITIFDINELKTYKNAPPEYKKDFDDSILGGRNMSVSKSKTKKLNSSFASSSGFNVKEEEVSLINPLNNINSENNPYHYNPVYIDPIDSYIA